MRKNLYLEVSSRKGESRRTSMKTEFRVQSSVLSFLLNDNLVL